MVALLSDIDTKLFLFLNGIHSPFFDKIMLFVSGKPQWIPLYLAIVAWIIYKFRMKAVFIIVTAILLIAITDQLSVKLFKETVQRLRPCHQPDLQSLIHLVNNHCGGRYGFVSNHAANSFALAVFTALVLKNRIFSVFIIFWATIVSYSRIYLGVHFPADVLAGAAFGASVAIFINWFLIIILKKIYPNHPTNQI